MVLKSDYFRIEINEIGLYRTMEIELKSDYFRIEMHSCHHPLRQYWC